ncbi:MAG: HAD family hydrolase [Opitutaceae bacterium]
MSAVPGFHAFLFDLDGTLIDHFAAIRRSYAHTLGRMGLPIPTPGQVRAAVGGGLERAVLRFVPRERLGEALAIYGEYWDRTLLDDVKPMPGARELLDRLHSRGARIAAASNKLGTSSRRICDFLGFTPSLRAVVGAGDTPWLKPAPEFTRHLLAALDARPDETLLVGDSPYDIEAAHAGGLPAWCVTTGTHDEAALLAAKADRVFGNLVELGRALPEPPSTPHP